MSGAVVALTVPGAPDVPPQDVVAEADILGSQFAFEVVPSPAGIGVTGDGVAVQGHGEELARSRIGGKESKVLRPSWTWRCVCEGEYTW